MSLPDFVFDNSHAVLTGAASGMGEQLAHQLAARGTRLTLVDRDAARLASVTEAIEAERRGAVLACHTVDLADADQVAALVKAVAADGYQVDLLINNAGVALGGKFVDVTPDEFDWVMAINFRAPVALTHGLLPSMRPQGHIVNVSSLFGLVAPAGQTAYSASKFAIRGFSEALRRELAPAGIGVTTVHPGGIRTRIAESARIAASASDVEAAAGRAAFAKMLNYPADRAAADIIAGIERRRGRVLIAPEAKLVDATARLLPVKHLEAVQVLQRTTRRVAKSARSLIR